MVMRLPKKKSKKVSNEAELDMVIRRLKFGLDPSQKIKLKKQMKQAGGMKSSDALKAAASMIKSQKTQSKGPAGKVMKKKRGGSIKKK